MSKPTSRVLALLELLQSGGVRTVAELADRLGVDERTVRRYVGHLVELDVPVDSVRGRYGGYRLAPGYRMPPLMLGDDEALAVVLGLVAGRRSGLATPAGPAAETALAKIRRVLPRRLAGRLDAVLGSTAFTTPPAAAEVDGTVLLTLADAVRHRSPVEIAHTSAAGRRSLRTVHPYGLVVHSGTWYVTGLDTGVGEDRTFRLDRITEARSRPGSFEPPGGPDPAQRVVAGFAAAEYRHRVVLRIRAGVDRIRTGFPVGVATVEEIPTDTAAEAPAPAETRAPAEAPAPAVSDAGADGAESGWSRVELRVERLDWLPAVLAAIDRPFVIEQPDELRALVLGLADRLAASAGRPSRPGKPGSAGRREPRDGDDHARPAGPFRAGGTK
ncbi:helix-turn-helix transcriptional regulator [Kitasatospora sp. NPDC088346]|uniref:helix-turn-helix transcriptional regulator n=1 Tax=Kitasatospora sp. NPDC088346 TaxID=3364073 RepID=UPI003822C70D